MAIMTEAEATTSHEVSNGNVFADLGPPDSEQELVKAKLTVQIYRLLKQRKVTQTRATRLFGTSQAQVSALMRCKPASVSVGRVMEFLTTLGQDVQVTVKPAGRWAHVSRRAGGLIFPAPPVQYAPTR